LIALLDSGKKEEVRKTNEMSDKIFYWLIGLEIGLTVGFAAGAVMVCRILEATFGSG